MAHAPDTSRHPQVLFWQLALELSCQTFKGAVWRNPSFIQRVSGSLYIQIILAFADDIKPAAVSALQNNAFRKHIEVDLPAVFVNTQQLRQHMLQTMLTYVSAHGILSAHCDSKGCCQYSISHISFSSKLCGSFRFRDLPFMTL